KLAAAPEAAVAYLGRKLRPVPPVDRQRVAALIADLDNATFAVREKAAAGLEELGEVASGACREALAGRPSAEVRQRLEAFVENRRRERRSPSPDQLRIVRAVEVLERIGTPGARQVLT